MLKVEVVCFMDGFGLMDKSCEFFFFLVVGGFFV